MCWSFKVALTFTILEIIAASFIFIRAIKSNDPYIHAQWRLLPLLSTIIIVELVEAIIWYRHEQGIDVLVNITEATSTYIATPSATNKFLTEFLGLAVFLFQPILAIWPIRMAGNEKTKDLLFVPQLLALIFAISALVFSFFSFFTGPRPTMSSLEDSNFASNKYMTTCTWIGRSGHHLHWTYAVYDAWYAPSSSGFTYLLLVTPVFFGRPWSFASGITSAMVLLLFGQIVYFGGSAEAGSVWCFSAILIFPYFILQPYVYPCQRELSNKEISSFIPPVDGYDIVSSSNNNNNKVKSIVATRSGTSFLKENSALSSTSVLSSGMLHARNGLNGAGTIETNNYDNDSAFEDEKGNNFGETVAEQEKSIV